MQREEEERGGEESAGNRLEKSIASIKTVMNIKRQLYEIKIKQIKNLLLYYCNGFELIIGELWTKCFEIEYKSLKVHKCDDCIIIHRLTLL